MIKLPLDDEQAAWLKRQMRSIHRNELNWRSNRRYAKQIYDLLNDPPWNEPEKSK